MNQRVKISVPHPTVPQKPNTREEALNSQEYDSSCGCQPVVVTGHPKTDQHSLSGEMEALHASNSMDVFFLRLICLLPSLNSQPGNHTDQHCIPNMTLFLKKVSRPAGQLATLGPCILTELVVSTPRDRNLFCVWRCLFCSESLSQHQLNAYRFPDALP